MIDGVVNMRDLGGIRTRRGRTVRPGLVHRSGHLGGLVADADALPEQARHDEEVDTGHAAGPDESGFDTTGIRTVFDLRTAAEVTRSPDRVPDHVRVTHLDVLADATASIAAHLEEIFADPSSAERVFEAGAVERHYEQTYRNLVLLDSARAAYGRLFTGLARLDHPVLFHCTAGKDRTGWAAAALLTLLEVDRDTIDEDFLSSNAPVLDAFGPLLDHFAGLGGDTKLLEPVFLVTPSYLQAAYDTVRTEFGSIGGYFTEALGVGPEVQDVLKERLLD